MTAELHAAAEPWRDFPAHGTSRPLVLVGPWLFGFSGFEDADSAEAFNTGRLLLAPDVPGGSLFATAGDEPAVAVVTNPALRLVRSKRVTHYFWTDRGVRPLPAWACVTRGAGSVHFPAAVVSGDAWRAATWLAPGCRWGVWATAASPDRLTLQYRFEGERDDWADYPRCQVLQTPSAVVVAPVRVQSAEPHSRPTGTFRTVDLRLDEPLGGRVLVNDRGRQVPVTNDGSDPWADHKPLG